jgi:hypothetical protein
MFAPVAPAVQERRPQDMAAQAQEAAILRPATFREPTGGTAGCAVLESYA